MLCRGTPNANARPCVVLKMTNSHRLSLNASLPLIAPSLCQSMKQSRQQANIGWIKTLSRHQGPLTRRNKFSVHLSEIRVNADRTALWQRCHDPACHARLLGCNRTGQVSLTILERARVQALGSNTFAGVSMNLSYYFMTKSQPFCHGEMLEGLAFVKFVERPIPDALVQLSQVWEAHFHSLAELWNPLSDFLQDQEGFGLHVLAFMEHLPENFNLKAEKEKDQEQFPADIFLLPQISMPETESSEQAENIKNDRKNPGYRPEASSHAFHKEPMPDKNDIEPDRQRYAIYTKAFDRIIKVTDLIGAEKRAVYQKQLEQESAPHRPMISRLARRMMRQLMAWQRCFYNFDQEEGVLDPRRLTSVVVNPFNTKVFMQEAKSPFPATVVSLLIDNSGSMKGEPVLMAALATEILASVLERCGVKVEILGYTTRAWDGGRSRQQWIESGKPANPGRLNDLLHIIYKAADTPWRRTRQDLGTMLHPGLLKENIDGEALLWAWHRLMVRPEPRRILLVLCDGSPHDKATMAVNGREYLEKHLRSTIETIENSPVQLGSVGMGQNVGRYYHRSVFLQKVENLGESLMGELLELLDQT